MNFSNTPLTLTPYGVSVLPDLKRGKSFVTLFYSYENKSQAEALDFIAAVTADFTGTGLVQTEAVKIDLRTTAKGCRLHLEAAVAFADGDAAKLLALADALRATSRKQEPGKAVR